MGCDLEPKRRTGDGRNLVRKTKKRLIQKILLERESACVYVYTREGVRQPNTHAS